MFTPSKSGRENDMICKWTNILNCTMPTKKSATTKAKKVAGRPFCIIFSPILYCMMWPNVSTHAEAKYEGEVYYGMWSNVYASRSEIWRRSLEVYRLRLSFVFWIKSLQVRISTYYLLTFYLSVTFTMNNALKSNQN